MKVLVLAPHTDDGELGCGATIARHVRLGHQVTYLALTDCGLVDLRLECVAACRVLGIKRAFVRDYPHRRFSERRQDILDDLLDEGSFDRVYVPCTMDTHQDHQVVTAEAIRAFKKTTILGYELPWNLLSFKAQAFQAVSGKDMLDKIEALHQYESQKHRFYMNDEYTYAHAMSRGVAIDVTFAEAFEVIRWVM